MIGELRLLPKNIFVWSVTLSSVISYKEDQIFEITNTVIGSDSVFAKCKVLLFNIPGHIPTLIDAKGEIHVSINTLIPYKINELEIILI